MATQHAIKKAEHETVVPFSPLTIMEEMERMMENFAPTSWLRPFHRELPVFSEALPQVDVIDREDEVIIKAALPGFKKDDVEVSINDHTVTIRGSSKSEEKKEKGDYYRHEIRSGSILRTVMLPAAVDDSRVKATFKDGILKISAAKKEGSKRRSVKIS